MNKLLDMSIAAMEKALCAYDDDPSPITNGGVERAYTTLNAYKKESAYVCVLIQAAERILNPSTHDIEELQVNIRYEKNLEYYQDNWFTREEKIELKMCDEEEKIPNKIKPKKQKETNFERHLRRSDMRKKSRFLYRTGEQIFPS